MNMAWHYAICIDLHSLIFSAKVQTLNQCIEILISDKNIDPIDCGKAYEIQTLFIVKLVLPTHPRKLGPVTTVGQKLNAT